MTTLVADLPHPDAFGPLRDRLVGAGVPVGSISCVLGAIAPRRMPMRLTTALAVCGGIGLGLGVYIAGISYLLPSTSPSIAFVTAVIGGCAAGGVVVGILAHQFVTRRGPENAAPGHPVLILHNITPALATSAYRLLAQEPGVQVSAREPA